MKMRDERRSLPRTIFVGLWLALLFGLLTWQNPRFWRDAGRDFELARELGSSRPEATLRAVNRALDRDPENAGYLTFRGYRHLEGGSAGSAIADFRRALELAPADPEAALGLAGALLATGDTVAARTTLRAVREADERPGHLLRRARLLEALGDAEEAYRLHRSTPVGDNLADRARLALRLERFSEAAPLFRELVDLHPGRRDYGEELAYALLADGRTLAAEAEYRRLLADDDVSPASRVRYAWLLNRERRYGEAWTVLGPLTAGELPLRARTAHWAGRHREAVVLLQQHLGARPEDREGWLMLAESCRRLGEEACRNAALRRALHLDPEDAEVRETLAALARPAKSAETVRSRREPASVAVGRDDRGGNAHDPTPTASDRTGVESAPSRTPPPAHASEAARPTGGRAGAASDAAIGTTATLPTLGYRDSNDLSYWQTGAVARHRTPSGLVVGTEVSHGEMSQRGVAFERTAAVVSIDSAAVSGSLTLSARAGVEAFEPGDVMGVGRLAAVLGIGDRTRASALLSRGTLWSGNDLPEPRQFNRVIDLPAVGPRLRVHEARLQLDRGMPSDQAWRVAAGRSWYGDGNEQAYLYGHWQTPVLAGLGGWTVLRPSLYLESFGDRRPEYFSPARLASVGLGAHTIRELDRWRLEAEATPHLMWSGRGTDFGLYGVVDATYRTDPVSLRGGLFFYWEPGEYRMARPFLQLQVPLGGSR